jgi:hypothetical protein
MRKTRLYDDRLPERKTSLIDILEELVNNGEELAECEKELIEILLSR